MRNLWNFHLEPLPVWMELSVPNSTKTDIVKIPVLLPHEILHCVHQAGPVQVWDVKFPNCIIPHACMREEAVQRYAHSKVAAVLSWSMEQSLKGVGPAVDMDNDCFTSPFQLSMKGEGTGTFFSRYYLCNNICDSCMATAPSANNILAYTHLSEDAACWMTELKHEDYVRHETDPSPWMGMPGFRLETVFFDAMHIVWLGTARVLLGSCLFVWHRMGLLGSEKYESNLKAFSVEMKDTIQLDMPRFTKSNTTHEDWAELGSVFKAMSVKTSLWFFCLKAAAFSAARPEEHDWNF
ncbi:nipblb [Symbiodinium sp. CCMP2456]|nr:nipblb [Symbiodinium sp. CCMP2456]